MVRNCGGQHQRRPGLSLMGLAACTILISSLSLKQTDWPLYLREPSSGGMAHLKPANIWPRGPSHTALVTLANQRPMQGVPAVRPVHCLHIHLSLNPMGFSSFCVSPGFFFPLSVWISTFSIHLLQSPLFVWPSRPPTLLLAHTSLIQEMKTESRRKGEEERQQVVLALKEEKEGLTSRCAALQADLDEKERQAKSQRDQRDAAQARVKVWKWGQVLQIRPCTDKVL